MNGTMRRNFTRLGLIISVSMQLAAASYAAAECEHLLEEKFRSVFCSFADIYKDVLECERLPELDAACDRVLHRALATLYLYSQVCGYAPGFDLRSWCRPAEGRGDPSFY